MKSLNSLVLFTLCAPLAWAHADVPAGRANVRATVQSRLREVRACFELALSQTGDAGKPVAVKWTIDDQGRAQNVRPATAAKRDPVETELFECIATKLKTWHFAPAPRGRTRAASYSFAFPA